VFSRTGARVNELNPEEEVFPAGSTYPEHLLPSETDEELRNEFS
jgi:hypothetical protein